MTEEDEIQQELDRRQAERAAAATTPTQTTPPTGLSPPGTDPLWGTPPGEQELFKRQTEEGGLGGALHKILEETPMMAGALKGGEKGAEIAREIPVPLPRSVKTVLGGTIGAGIGATGSQTGYEELKRKLGIGDDRSDSFSESLLRGLGAGNDAMEAELWGRTTLGPLANASGFTPSISKESAGRLAEMQAKLRAIYEKTAGTPLIENDAFYNPSRWFRKGATELDDTAVVQRLKDAGYDPEQARRLALTGGSAADLLDNRGYAWLDKLVGNTRAQKAYNTTKNQMILDSVKDLGSQFGQVLPDELLGQAVHDAVNGKYNTLVDARRIGMNGIEKSLNDAAPTLTGPVYGKQPFTFKGDWLRRGAGGPLGSPGGLVTSLSDSPTFGEVQDVRTKLGIMMHDERLPDATRLDAQNQAKVLDRKVLNQLPSTAQQDYRNWANADDAINKGKYDSSFIQGLITSDPAKGYRAYADTILNKADLGNFKKLEAAAGPDVANNVRAAIWNRVADASTDGSNVVRPMLMKQQLYNQGDVGRLFLEGVMGKQTVANYEKFASALDALSDKTHEMGYGAIGGRKNSVLNTGNAVGTALGAMLGHMVGPETLATVGTVLFTAPFVSRIINSPEATKWATKVAMEAAKGTNPARFTRLTANLTEALGLTPQQIMQTSGAGPDVIRDYREGIAKMRQGIMPDAIKQMLNQGPPIAQGGPLTQAATSLAGYPGTPRQ